MNSLKAGETLKGPAKISGRMDTPVNTRGGHSGKKGGETQSGQQAASSAVGDRGTFSHRDRQPQTLWDKIKESNRKLRDAVLRQEPQRAAQPKIGLYSSNNANKKKPVR